MATAIAAVTAFACIALGLPGAAFAHGGEHLDADQLLNAWTLSPDIVVMTALALGLYLRGMWRRRNLLRTAWKPLAYISGVGLVFLALQSPIDPMAERLFWMHQVQHMLLRIVGPMLVAISQPAGLLVAGMPRWLRAAVLKPLVSTGATRTTFAGLGHPAIATLIFVASLYVWEIPALHDAALLDEGLHYLMHATMLAAGLLFFFRIFDARPAPKGIRYGVRLMMLWVSVLTGLLLGALTALKPVAIYTAYDVAGRLFDMPGISDEQVGGVLIWIPSNMMCLLAILLTVHAMGRHEERETEKLERLIKSGSNSAALEWPTTGAELILRSRRKNRQMALGFAGFSATMFFAAILVSLLVLNFEHGSAMAEQSPNSQRHASIENGKAPPMS